MKKFNIKFKYLSIILNEITGGPSIVIHWRIFHDELGISCDDIEKIYEKIEKITTYSHLQLSDDEMRILKIFFSHFPLSYMVELDFIEYPTTTGLNGTEIFALIFESIFDRNPTIFPFFPRDNHFTFVKWNEYFFKNIFAKNVDFSWKNEKIYYKNEIFACFKNDKIFIKNSENFSEMNFLDFWKQYKNV